GEPAGVLLLASPRDDLDDAEVKTFASTVAGQLAQAVSLAGAAGRLRTGEERYRAIVENANDALFLLDPSGEVLEVNRSGEEILGRPAASILHHRLRDFAAPDAPDTGWEGLERVPAGEAVRLEPVQIARPDGTAVPVELSASLLRAGGRSMVLAIARDVSRRRALERRLFMAQKMEAVGQLAGGIAHDFNNLLMVINGYAEILLGRTGEGRPGAAELGEILRAGQRAAALTSQLLGFSRRQVVRPRVLDLPAATAALEEDLRRVAGPRASLRFVHGEGQRPVKIDPVQLEQVLVQLVLNASEALPDGAGAITVGTGAAVLDEAFVRANEGARAGPHTFLSVVDGGRGMDEETLSRCFEPFFSTKEVGKGSGLGLATVYGVVKQNDGYVRIESAPGRGTTVRVYLPPVEPVAPPPGEGRAPSAGREEAAGSASTVLVIEDEWAVRYLVRQVLRHAGYQVLEAESGEDALELAMKHQGRIDLVLSDVVMKGMGGRDAVRRLRVDRPDLKVLLMSGYSYDALVEDEGADLGEQFLPKPFSTEALLAKVSGLLRAVKVIGTEPGSLSSLPPRGE
ncbi:MAG: PAS domain S-box protein, partial [Planctomycetaceae bacterium]|nr:PAS domain S-box protein [Planctomycetaceae bacterium]